MKNKFKSIFYFSLFLTLFFIDRLVKSKVLDTLKDKDITIFKGLTFTLTWNRGVSFGLFSSQSPTVFYILIFTIALIIILFTIHTAFEFRTTKKILFEVLVITGALSNLVDRIFYKGVIDFIDLYIGTWHWPTFNLADIFIVVGAIGILGRFIHHGYISKD